MLTCGGFNLVCFTLDLFDDSVYLDNVGNPRGEPRDEIGVLCVGNLNLENQSAKGGVDIIWICGDTSRINNKNK